ncbi:MAG: hypothetical protein IKA65_09865 [Lentisphaeria bacterium]|nr:hypothetical protein [Lentisphaeria bacterium]
MLSISNFREGAIVNRHHGMETDRSLTVVVEGVNTFGTPVRVNGKLARQTGLHFSASVELTEKINIVEAATTTCYGEFTQKITLVWDKKSFRRCNFYIDDHIFLFTDLAEMRPRKAFDHFYLKKLKELHDKYGLKVTLNTFYHNAHKPFTLDKMPDIWRDEFAANSHWLKFALHAYSEFPDRPYAESSCKDFRRDYDLLQKEITRFAGENSFIEPVVLHWNNISPGVANELLKLGCKCYSESMRHRVMATPPADELTDEERQHKFRSEIYVSPHEPIARHYGFAEEIDYLEKYSAIYDPGLKIFFHHDWIICNLLGLKDIPELFQQTLSRAELYKTDIFSAGGHEQYSFPYYGNYQPDHLQKLEETIRLMVETAQCKPVFYQDGLLGNPAWDE